jgi:hypothetical protein
LGASRLDLGFPALVSQSPSTPDFASVIAGVLHSVHDRHFSEVEWADAFQACNVDTELLRIRTTLMMCVDTALRTKEMLGFAGIEPVTRQLVVALNDT